MATVATAAADARAALMEAAKLSRSLKGAAGASGTHRSLLAIVLAAAARVLLGAVLRTRSARQLAVPTAAGTPPAGEGGKKGQEKGALASAASRQSLTTASDGQSSDAEESPRGDDEPEPSPQRGPALCAAARAATWTVLRRSTCAVAGALVGYYAWLRLWAPQETVRRHFFAFGRFLGQFFFDYDAKTAAGVAGVGIPNDGAALVCIYHGGFLPTDMYFLHEWIHRTTGRFPMTLAADFLFRVPVLGFLVRSAGAVPANRAVALEHLKQGGIVIVAPGGLREAMSPASADYAVRWYGRKGFAELAQLAGAPIIPVFTRNIRETFVVMGGESSIVQYLYKLTKLPSTPFFGPIPQKLTSVIGAPLPHVPGMSASDTAQRARRALTALMRSHRRHVAAQYLKFAGTP